MLTTGFTELVGCSVPIQQVGMGGLSTPRLAAAVADAGGLGMVSVYGGPPAEIAQVPGGRIAPRGRSRGTPAPAAPPRRDTNILEYDIYIRRRRMA